MRAKFVALPHQCTELPGPSGHRGPRLRAPASKNVDVRPEKRYTLASDFALVSGALDSELPFVHRAYLERTCRPDRKRDAHELPRLRHERHRLPRPPGCPRRTEAGAAPDPLGYVRGRFEIGRASWRGGGWVAVGAR